MDGGTGLVGYLQHKHCLAKALDAISDHGLPVDRKRQDELRAYLESEEQRLTEQIQQLVPDDVRPINRKTPYKSLPKDLRARLKERGLLQKGLTLDYYVTNHYDLCNSLDYYWRQLGDDLLGDSGLVRVLPFNPNSSDQLLAYIRWQMGHGDMTKRWYIPVHIDTGQPTVGKDELQRLIEETDDDVLKATQQIKKLNKIRGTYTAGYWVPQADGRVHAEFGFGTASGQLTARYPNVMQYPQHGGLAKRAKECIRAEAGHTFIKRDMRSFHARSLGWIAEDKRYYDLADYDVHSYVTAYFLKLPVADSLLDLDGPDLRAALAAIKAQHKDVRDQQAKRAILGLGFHMGAEKLWRMNPNAFASIEEAENLIKLIQSLFPKAFYEFPKKIEKLIKQKPRLISPTGHIRWMWSQDLEEAVSYLPANIAHCHIQDSLLIMHERGLLQRWGVCNFIHDCIVFHCPDALVKECLAGSREIMERESNVLINSLGPFVCRSDAEVGMDFAHMEAAA